ncbi:hypothetical protein [Tychonema bourrellyi]|uniref:hypothetical protein n=1 Tax=Tychonema bourrellyi TaxID=54313 RepID=UPI0015D4E356|nr:hypothetical protein [Tychonema bourrellyi]
MVIGYWLLGIGHWALGIGHLPDTLTHFDGVYPERSRRAQCPIHNALILLRKAISVI